MSKEYTAEHVDELIEAALTAINFLGRNADADHNGISFIPNEEMQIQTALWDAVQKLEATK